MQSAIYDQHSIVMATQNKKKIISSRTRKCRVYGAYQLRLATNLQN